jgi:GntR family histidine utilization transcriptional repressor
LTRLTTYREVQAEILHRITGGPWGPGTLLPPETDLAAEFGCSRATINRALSEVSDLGLIDRRRKSGTRVRLAPLRQARFAIPLVRAEIEATGAIYRYALVLRETLLAPAALRARLNLNPGSQVVHLVCVHYADGAPYQLEERWINATALPQVHQQDFRLAGPNEWLVVTVPFSEVEISLNAIAAGPAEVDHLGHRPGDPVFRIERTTWWQGAGITHVALGYRPGHRMTAHY